MLGPGRKQPFSKDDDLLSHLLIDVALFKETQQQTRKMDKRFKATKDYEEDIRVILADLKKTGDLDEACYAMERHKTCYRNLRSKEGSKDEDRDKHAFKSHIRRYLSLHAPDAPFELFTTERYLFDPDAESELSELSDDEYKNHKYWTWEKPVDEDATPMPPKIRTGPLDLGVRAKEDFEVGEIIPRLLGKVHDLTDEQDDALRAQTLDFSVTMNAGRNCFQALFGPARFVNHDCNANVELTRRAGNMVFEVIRDIKAGEEILSDYGDSYFGEKNEHCKCATCQKNERGAFSNGVVAEEDLDLSDLYGRVTRSREVLVPMTRAERLEQEERDRIKAERAARLALWEAAGGALGKRKRDLDREEKMPSYLKDHIDRDANRAEREERIRRRAEGLPVFSSPKPKRRASAPVEPERPVPAYLRLGVPKGQGERAQRSLRRLGMDVGSAEEEGAKKKKKPEKLSLEQQIAQMTARIRQQIAGVDSDDEMSTDGDDEAEADDSDSSEDEKPAPKVAKRVSTVAVVQLPARRFAVTKPISAPAAIDVSRRTNRRSGIDMSQWSGSGKKLSVEQQIAALTASTRASVNASRGRNISRSSSPSSSESSEDDLVADALTKSASSRTRSVTVAKAVSTSAGTVSAAVSSSGGRKQIALEGRLSNGTRFTRNATLASGVEIPPIKDLIGFSPLASLSSKRASERRTAVPTNETRRQMDRLYNQGDHMDEDSEQSTPAASALFEAGREDSLTSQEDVKR